MLRRATAPDIRIIEMSVTLRLRLMKNRLNNTHLRKRMQIYFSEKELARDRISLYRGILLIVICRNDEWNWSHVQYQVRTVEPRRETHLLTRIASRCCPHLHIT